MQQNKFVLIFDTVWKGNTSKKEYLINFKYIIIANWYFKLPIKLYLL